MRRYAAKVVDAGRPEFSAQLAASAARALALFAGVATADGGNGNEGHAEGHIDGHLGGLQAILGFIEANVPESERQRAGEVLVRTLSGVLFELAQITRERVDLKPLASDDKTQDFMRQALLSLSDAQFYTAPMAFQLKDFTQVQASVFQVARAPGKNVVYLGCALLILGVFAMLYVRERRVWVWLVPKNGSTQATMALSTNRKTMDGDKEFEMLKTKLLQAPL